jgi:hypothetical protein
MDKNVLSNQLKSLLDIYEELQKKSKYNDLSDLSKADRQSLVTRSISAITRITGTQSAYSKDVDRILRENKDIHIHTSSILGIVKALKEDIDAGYIQSLIEIIHSEIFSDFLEMASFLNDNGFKDAAAVLAGSTLENHLRQLARKNNLPIISADGKPLKADRLNTDLTSTGAYNRLDQKNVTAWLDLRNKAAHGHYSEYNKDQVKLLISSIQDFITRNPA